MRTSRRNFLTICGGAAAISVTVPKLIGAPAVARPGFVKAQGQELLTPAGEKLLLRGINLGNWLEPEGYMFLFKGPQAKHEIEGFFNELVGEETAEAFWKEYRRNYVTRADIDFIRKIGLNSVRIPFNYRFFLPGGEGFALLDPAIEWCKQAGLWAILDMHGAPGGQTGTNIDDSWGYPWLFESERDQALACDIWRAIAGHYRDETTVLGYDLLNEPIPPFPRLRQYNERLEPLYRRMTKAIREVDPNHTIILGGAQWDTNFDVFGAPFDPNLLYQFHKYWTDPGQQTIQKYVDFRAKNNVPVWLGESGENKDEWIEKFVQTLEQNHIGWCFWPYKKMEKSSCLVTIEKPQYWDEVAALADMAGGTGAAEKRIAARPTLEHARAALDDLLKKIRFEACHVNGGYIRALVGR